MNEVGRFPRAILFDLGDTLLREVRLELQAAIARLVELGDGRRPVDRDNVMRTAGALYQEIRNMLRNGICEVRMQGFLQLVCDCHGIAIARSIDEVELGFWKALCTMEPLPGVRDVLATLRSRGIKCGVVSNSVFTSSIHRYELRRHGLETSIFRALSAAPTTASRSRTPGFSRRRWPSSAAARTKPGSSAIILRRIFSVQRGSACAASG